MRRIVPLRFDASICVQDFHGRYHQVLPGLMLLRLDRSRHHSIKARVASKDCPCCGGTMKLVDTKTWDEVTFEIREYFACESCGYWKSTSVDSITALDITIPYATSFNPHAETPSLLQLAEEIHRNPSSLHLMNPRRFEIFVGSVLRDFYHCEVYHVGQSGDDGIDLMVIEKDEPFLVQVKRRGNPVSVEGIDVVKLLFASAFARGADKGMVVSTAQRFSRVAKRWIHLPRLKDVSFRMELVDINRLMSILNVVRKANEPEPWRAHCDAQNRESTADRERIVQWDRRELQDGDLIRWEQAGLIRVCLLPERPTGECAELHLDTQSADALFVGARSMSQCLQETQKACGTVTKVQGEDFILLISTIPRELIDELTASWTSRDPELVINLAEWL